jgi:hypothetical protein
VSGTEKTSVTPAAVGGVQTVRRVITYLLLLTMVIIAAIGISGLLDRALEAGNTLVSSDSGALAQSLAFALIAGPLAALLWWLTWRKAAMDRDRASVAWPLYLVVASTVALLTFTVALFGFGANAVAGELQWSSLAVAIVWGLVWVWHYWMWRHPAKGPTRLVGVAPAIASLIGLTFATGGLVFALSSLIDSALDTFGSVVAAGSVFEPVLQSLVWAVGGALIWWWHWFRSGVRTQTAGFANVLLVYITGFASFAVFAFGATLTLSVVLELVTFSDDPLAVTLDPLGIAIATAALGALVMVYHLRVVAGHPVVIGKAVRLVTSGVALTVAATGVGVTVNALLATLASPIVGSNVRNLLLGGISALVVGGVLWWTAWGPRGASCPERATTPGRRVYLVVIFGVSALVALITLLVIGYQLFSFALDSGSGESLLERIRAALGLLVATVLVAAYHFSLWRHDRAATVGSEAPRTIGRVTLVTSAGAGAEVDVLVEAIRDATGARVSVLRRTDAVAGEPDAAALVAALAGVEANHVLVVAGAKSKAEVIRLGD